MKQNFRFWSYLYGIFPFGKFNIKTETAVFALHCLLTIDKNRLGRICNACNINTLGISFGIF